MISFRDQLLHAQSLWVRHDAGARWLKRTLVCWIFLTKHCTHTIDLEEVELPPSPFMKAIPRMTICPESEIETIRLNNLNNVKRWDVLYRQEAVWEHSPARPGSCWSCWPAWRPAWWLRQSTSGWGTSSARPSVWPPLARRTCEPGPCSPDIN